MYRTDLNGDIYITSDGETVTITTDKDATDAEIMTGGGGGYNNTPTSSATPEIVETPVSGSVNYVFNTNTGKFHKPSCSSVKKIKEKNKKEFDGTREEAIQKGYEPCGNCKL